MVHALIKHYKMEKTVLNLKGVNEEAPYLRNEKVNMSNWNPLLVAI